ncbi:MAG: site-specific integrase [Candidatus Cybelea sp.]
MPRTPSEPRKERARERGDGTIWERTRKWKAADGTTRTAKQYVVSFSEGTASGKRKRTTKYFKKQRDAKAWWRQHLAGSGKPEASAKIAADAAHTTLREQIEAFLEATYEACEPTTWNGYRNSLAKVAKKIGSMELRTLSSDHVNNALTAIAKDVSPSMASRCRTVLHTLLEEARSEGKIASNPAVRKRIRRSRKVRALSGASRDAVKAPSTDQVKALLEAAKGDRIAHAMLTILATCGLRAGECYGLRWTDIDWDQRTLTIRQTVREVAYLGDDDKVHYETEITRSAKTRESTGRTIEMPKAAIVALRKRQRTAEREGHGSALVFPSERGLPLRATNFARRTWTPIREEAGVECTLHSLRHYMTSTLIEAGSDVKSVSERLGHSDVGLTLSRYHHAGKRSQGRHTAILDDVFGKGR